MKQKIFPIICFGLIVVLAAGFMGGCGSTGNNVRPDNSMNDDVADIDALLGLADQQTGEAEPVGDESEISESDVLKLLGVTEEAQADTPPVRKTTPPATTENENMQTQTEEAASNQRNTATQQAAETANRGDYEQKTEPVNTRNAVPRNATYAQRYEEARSHYMARRYREAIQGFESLLVEEAGNSLSDNCQYWIGESYYGLGNYQQALVAFEKVFSFTRSNKDDDAQLKLGLCYIRLKDNEKAREEFQKLINNYPTSEYVSVARRFLSQIE